MAVPSAVAGELGAAGHEVLAVIAVLAALVASQHSAGVGEARAVEGGLLAVTLVSVAAGWVGVVLHIEPLAEEAVDVWRAAGTVTYSNALGALAAVALPLAARRAARSADPRHALVIAGVVAGVGITLSRGAVLAAVAALVVLAIVDRPAVLNRGVLLGMAAGAAAAGAGLPAAAAEDPAWFPAVLAVGGLAVAVLICVAGVPSRRSPAERTRDGPARPRGVAVGLLVLGLGMAVAALAATASELDAADRLGVGSGDRADELDAALEAIGDDPWWGTGPGDRALLLDGDVPRVAEFVHNEYLQVVVDFGLAGAALITGGVIVAATALRWRPDDQRRHVAVAGLAALLVTGALDFTWHVLVVPLAATTLVGLATDTTQTRRRTVHDPNPPPPMS